MSYVPPSELATKMIDAGEANTYGEYGRPVERSTRIAVSTVGRVMWELIEPLDEEGIYGLARRRPAKLAEHVSDGPRRTLRSPIYL